MTSTILANFLRQILVSFDVQERALMKLLKVFSVLVALLGIELLAMVVVPSAFRPFDSSLHAQARPFDSRPLAQARQERPARELSVLSGRGAEIGVSVRDVPLAEAEPQKSTIGVLVEDVHLDGPAEKAGVKRSDIIVEFDGEHVRSARQFARLVQETAPGRTVKAVVVRDGQKKDVQITPESGRTARFTIDGDRMLDRLGDDLANLTDHLPQFNFNFDFDLAGPGRRLGVTVNELTSQLADYFGTRDGLLVTSVAEGSSAARAGLKAGDVITSVNGDRVRSRDDLVRGLRDAREGEEVTVGIVRDKKETSVKAKIDAPRRTLRGRPV
jgi:serine protease Do